MKILLVQNRYYPALGGGEKHTYLLAKYLALDGHEVTVYTTSSLSNEDVYSLAVHPPFVRRPLKRTNLLKKEAISDTVVHRYSLNWRFWSLNWAPEMFEALKETTMDFELVHAHGYHHSASLVSCYYAKKYRRPFILTGHDLTIPSSLSTDARLFKKLYDKTVGRYLLKNATGLIALTEDHVAQYAARGADVRKISIIPNGIELEDYGNQQRNQNLMTQYGISKEDKILLFVGRIEGYKGIQDVIAILPQILESFPETVLLVAGLDYGFKSQLEAFIAQKNLAANVVFTGPLSEEQLAQLYKIASIFVFPSRMEGFGRVLLEAMASGTLCIAYSIPAVRRVIENGRNGVLVGNKSELLDRILYYFSHPEKQTEIESAALKSVTAFDIRQIVKATEQVYQRALG